MHAHLDDTHVTPTLNWDDVDGFNGAGPGKNSMADADAATAVAHARCDDVSIAPKDASPLSLCTFALFLPSLNLFRTRSFSIPM